MSKFPGFNASYFQPNETMGFHKVGKNVRVHQLAVIADPESVEIGDNVRIDAGTVISCKSIRIGSNVAIHAHCVFSGRGRIDIADFAAFSHGCKLYTSTDDLSIADHSIADDEHTISAAITLERHATLCSNAVVLPGVTLGWGCYVGAFSLVKKDVPPLVIAGGVPARWLADRKLTQADFEAFERRVLERQK